MPVRFFQWLHDTLHQPLKVLVVCLILIFINLVVEGSLFQLWSLHRDFTDIQSRITNLRIASQKLEMKIRKANDPNFIEMEARSRFDLAKEGDLIFVFSEDENLKRGGPNEWK